MSNTSASFDFMMEVTIFLWHVRLEVIKGKRRKFSVETNVQNKQLNNVIWQLISLTQTVSLNIIGGGGGEGAVRYSDSRNNYLHQYMKNVAIILLQKYSSY